jgi:hypothetical protein
MTYSLENPQVQHLGDVGIKLSKEEKYYQAEQTSLLLLLFF